MKKKKILVAAFICVFSFGLLTACADNQQQDTAAPAPAETAVQASNGAPPSEGVSANNTLIIATANETPSIAPARHTAAAGSFKNVMTHNGLARLCPDTLQPIPDLAVEWVALSDTLFEFRLHEGILFHNGEELTAYDVVASWYYVRNYPQQMLAHGSAVGIEMVDRYTVIIDTGVPNASLLFDLTGHGNFVMPKSLIESGHDFTASPIGSGPFVFEEWRFGDSLHFSAFEDYFLPEQAAILDYVVWRIIPEGASRTIALETGEVDLIVEVPYPDIVRMQQNPDITVFMRPGTAFHHLVLNTTRPQFENIVVRQALNMAINQEELVAVAFDGLAVPTRAQVPIIFPGTTYEGVLPFDPEGARALLAEHNIDPATLAFDMIASSEERRRLAEVVQAQMLDIGIPTTITLNDHATTIQRMLDGDYDTGFGMWSASFLISTMRGVLYGGVENRSRINNPELNDLISQAVATIDTDARNAAFEAASVVANEYVGIVPTHLAYAIRAFDARLAAPEIGPTGAMNLNTFYWMD